VTFFGTQCTHIWFVSQFHFLPAHHVKYRKQGFNYSQLPNHKCSKFQVQQKTKELPASFQN